MKSQIHEFRLSKKLTTMSKKLIIAVVVLFFTTTTQAQKFAFVDMEYILGKMPSYTEAQKQLDKVADDWQKEVTAKMKGVDDMYKQFQAEQVLMTEPMKQQKIKDIETKEKEVKDYQKAKFGPSGDLFKKRQELVKPIQDKIYNEVQKYSIAKGYDFILDRSSGPTMLYAGDRFNKSDDILAALGISAKTTGK
jgi:outer membrane protein